MLILLRILITGALIYVFGLMRDEGINNHIAGDLTQAYYMGIVLVLSILMAAVWAPYLGERIADPITGELTCGSYGNYQRRLPRLIRWFDRHRWRRLTLFCCILEGLDSPDLPMPFLTGLRNTSPGSWWEKVFAREVFRFDNIQNCLEAADILKERHQIEVEDHDRASVNVALRKRDRVTRPPRPPVPVPAAPQAKKPKRNHRIRLFLDPDKTPQAEQPARPPIPKEPEPSIESHSPIH